MLQPLDVAHRNFIRLFLGELLSFLLHHPAGELLGKGHRLAIAGQKVSLLIHLPETGGIHGVKLVSGNNLSVRVDPVLSLGVHQHHPLLCQVLGYDPEGHQGGIANLGVLARTADTIFDQIRCVYRAVFRLFRTRRIHQIRKQPVGLELSHCKFVSCILHGALALLLCSHPVLIK